MSEGDVKEEKPNNVSSDVDVMLKNNNATFEKQDLALLGSAMLSGAAKLGVLILKSEVVNDPTR